MHSHKPDRLIVLLMAAYAMLVIGWAALVYRLPALAGAGPKAQWPAQLSAGIFVAATLALLYLALRRAPPGPGPEGSAAAATRLLAMAAGGDRQRWMGYALAVAAIVAATLILPHIAVPGIAGTPVLLLLFPLLLCALVGGLGPGLVCTVIAAAGSLFYAGSPGATPALSDPALEVRVGLLTGAGVVASLFGGMLRIARREADVLKYFYNAALVATPDAVVAKDRQGRYLLVNRAAAELVGREPQAMIGHDDRALYDAAAAAGIMDAEARVMREGVAESGERSFRGPTGPRTVVSTMTPLADAEGRVIGVCTVSHDMTQRRRIEARLAASEERLRLAKLAAGIGVFEYDPQSRIFKSDDEMRALLDGGVEESAEHDAFLAAMHPQDRDGVRDALWRVLDPDGKAEFDVEFGLAAPGSARRIAAVGRRFCAPGRPPRLLAMARDVTEARRQERAYRDSRAEMESLVKQQTAVQTAAAIAHELNQPLNAVSAYNEAALGMLRAGNREPEKLLQALERGAAQAQRAGASLHELLDFLHQSDVAYEPFNLNASARAAVKIAADDGYGDFNTVLLLEDGLPPVMGNQAQIEKVLVNLLRNGVQAMRTGGVRAGDVTVTVRTAKERQMAQVTVQDAGPGVTPDVAQRIFDPFFSTKSGGMGLGLAISRALVEAHGGQLWYEGEVGSGAIFHFSIPFA